MCVLCAAVWMEHTWYFCDAAFRNTCNNLPHLGGVVGKFFSHHSSAFPFVLHLTVVEQPFRQNEPNQFVVGNEFHLETLPYLQLGGGGDKMLTAALLCTAQNLSNIKHGKGTLLQTFFCVWVCICVLAWHAKFRREIVTKLHTCFAMRSPSSQYLLLKTYGKIH